MKTFRAFRDFEDVYAARAAARSSAQSKLVAYALMAAVSVGASYVSLSLARDALAASIDPAALARFLPETAQLPAPLTRFLDTPLDQYLATSWWSTPPAAVSQPPRVAAARDATAVDRSWHSTPEPAPAKRIEPVEPTASGGGITEVSRQRSPAADKTAATQLRFVER